MLLDIRVSLCFVYQKFITSGATDLHRGVAIKYVLNIRAIGKVVSTACSETVKAKQHRSARPSPNHSNQSLNKLKQFMETASPTYQSRSHQNFRRDLLTWFPREVQALHSNINSVPCGMQPTVEDCRRPPSQGHQAHSSRKRNCN
eukprot:GHVT01095891.1.p2 GENE.GHVT01095891.1~~GHVT01095891.1.p2  ORF type:complete len:145 (+),score=9.68 GHVT01095891.1:1386-1820(+)